MLISALNVKSNTMNQAHQMALYELHEIEEYRKNIQKSIQLNEKSQANKNLHKIFESFSIEVFVITYPIIITTSFEECLLEL